MKFYTFLFCCVLFLLSGCSDDNSNCGKSVYPPMKYNPAKEVEWLKKMIQAAEASGQTNEILWYKWDEKDFYASYFYYNPDSIKTDTVVMKQANEMHVPSCIYDSRGGLFYTTANHTDENARRYKEFTENARFEAQIWYYNSCNTLQDSSYY